MTALGTETTVQIVAVSCGRSDCDVIFGMSEDFHEKRRNDHKTWYCPNGHPRMYPGRSREQKLEDELEAVRSLAQRESQRRQEAEQRQAVAERQRAAARGQVTKIKRRVGRGVCPCCNRTFADLGRHMAGQHPEFADGES